MAGLADDWPENQQTCVDVLCAYLRLPHDLDPGEDGDPAERTAYRANREVNVVDRHRDEVEAEARTAAGQ
jgi:hypothetical protein